MPPTGSLNVTSISVSSVTVAPAAGDKLTTVGAIESTTVYCHVAPGASASNGLGVDSRSTMPCPEAQLIPTAPSGGWGKLNVYIAFDPLKLVAGVPLTSRSEAFTPSIGSLKFT